MQSAAPSVRCHVGRADSPVPLAAMHAAVAPLFVATCAMLYCIQGQEAKTGEAERAWNPQLIRACRSHANPFLWATCGPQVPSWTVLIYSVNVL